MFHRLSKIFAMAFLLMTSTALATFSIVAVDPETGEVGSAGASCISGVYIINDIHPGVGAINTQSYWNSSNQNNARNLMNSGWSPEEIIEWLENNDAGGNPSIRQYGIVDLVAGGRSAAFTGSNCLDWKGHLTGPTYAIQGNILLGPDIIADMETAFLANPDDHLALRLMAAMQAANVPGADSRCLGDDKPAISAYVSVAKPDDTLGDLFLDLNVNNTSSNQNPIDILQGLFDAWLPTGLPSDMPASVASSLMSAHPNPFNPKTRLNLELSSRAAIRLSIHDVAGRELDLIYEGVLERGDHEFHWIPATNLGSGVYFARMQSGEINSALKLVLIK